MKSFGSILMDKIMYFKSIPCCYDVSNDMVSKRPSQKDLRSNPNPSGGVLGISSDGDDRMEAKVKTPKKP